MNEDINVKALNSEDINVKALNSEELGRLGAAIDWEVENRLREARRCSARDITRGEFENLTAIVLRLQAKS